MKRITAALLALSCLFAGGQVALAAEGQMLIVNKATNKLAYYNAGELVQVYTVATGANRDDTPEGWFTLSRKVKNVPFYKTNIPGGDPRNPLGDRWLGLSATSDGMTYGIHGTNDERSIGTYSSNGCIRMYNNDVRWLFDQVALNTPVTITRTSQGFDRVAEARGYELTINNVVPYPTSMMVLDTAYLYTKPHDYYQMSSSISSQQVYAFEKKADWYHIKTWFGDAWIKGGNHVLVGAVTEINKTVELTKTTSLYPYPNTDTKPLAALAPQQVTAVQEWKGWYRIKSWMGDVWVKKDES